MRRGEIWWVDFGVPRGSEPGYRRPAVIVSSDSFNRSTIRTVTLVAITTNLQRANETGNVLLDTTCGLPRVSVINVTQLVTVDKRHLLARVGA